MHPTPHANPTVRTMRLLHIITDLRTGGAEHLMVHLLPHLRSLGHHVSLLCFDGTPTPFMQALPQEL